MHSTPPTYRPSDAAAAAAAPIATGLPMPLLVLGYDAAGRTGPALSGDRAPESAAGAGAPLVVMVVLAWLLLLLVVVVALPLAAVRVRVVCWMAIEGLNMGSSQAKTYGFRPVWIFWKLELWKRGRMNFRKPTHVAWIEPMHTIHRMNRNSQSTALAMRAFSHQISGAPSPVSLRVGCIHTRTRMGRAAIPTNTTRRVRCLGCMHVPIRGSYASEAAPSIDEAD